MLYRLLMLVLAVSLYGPTVAAERPAPLISIWLSGGNGPYRELAERLESGLQEQHPHDLQVQQLTREGDHWPRLDAAGDGLLVAVGTAASTHLLQHAGGRPVLSLLVPSPSYRELERGQAATAPGLRSAIFLDQPLWRQLALIRLALPGTGNIGVLLGPRSRELRPRLEAGAREHRLDLNVATVDSNSRYLTALSRLLDRSEVLLAIPDQDVFNRQTLQGILLSSYRREIPMFGFSAGYVRAGALAAVYSTPAQIGEQAAEWIATWLRNPAEGLPPPAYPAYYGVAVNQQVARSLNIRLPGGAELRRRLKETEDSQR